MKLSTAAKIAFTIGLLTLALAFVMAKVASAQITPTITVETIDVTEGDSIVADLILSEVPTGLSGYAVTITIPTILSITSVDVNDIGLQSVVINDNSVRIFVIDLFKTIEPGDTNIVLATFNMETVDFGNDNVIISLLEIDDEGGFNVAVDIINGSVNVARIFPILPGETERTADLDNDGLAEDLNGNGRFDFQDIVLLFIHKESQEVLDNFDLFDYNGNTLIDFDDVIGLFDHLIQSVR